MAKVSEVFERYYQALVSTLPMKDDNFTSKLRKRNLLAGGIIDSLATLGTSKERASYFLDYVIKQKIDEDHLPFDKLLGVMEESNFQHVKELAVKIKTDYKWSLKCMFTRNLHTVIVFCLTCYLYS